MEILKFFNSHRIFIRASLGSVQNDTFKCIRIFYGIGMRQSIENSISWNEKTDA